MATYDKRPFEARLIPDEHCECGSVLIPRRAASRTAPRDADYVCLRCGRPYQWSGTPQRLVSQPGFVDEDVTNEDVYRYVSLAFGPRRH